MIPTHARRPTGVLVQLLVCLALVCASPVTLRPASPDASNVPELPRTFVDTTYALPAGGTVFNVTSPATLQTVLDLANPGDVVVLTAGMTYTGNFTLRNQSGPGWIYVISSAMASLPAPGTRVTPSAAAAMPKIVTTNQGPAIGTDPGAHHYRFVGIEITTTWATTADSNFGLVALDDPSATTTDQLPHHITFDRCYIHGTPGGNIRRGVLMNGASLAVIDSYISDIHEVGADSQATESWGGDGPMKITNNYLSAAGENVCFGGNDPPITNQVPSDIEIRGNYLFKPLAWKSASWVVKNLLELKNAHRVLIEGNVLENNWEAAQNGFSILITPRNQDGGCLGCGVQDVTVRLNRLINGDQGFNISGEDDEHVSQRTQRVWIQDNLIGLNGTESDGRIYQVTHGPVDLVITHNTAPIANTTFVTDNSDAPKSPGFVFTNNIAAGGANGFTGTGTVAGTPSLDGHYAGWVFVANAIFPTPDGTYPSGNFFPADLAAVGFLNVPAGDYSLAPASPFKNAGTDGRDLGANIDAVTAAATCALTGTCGSGAPLIAGVQVVGRTSSSATIAWVTNQVSDSQVEYGLTTAYGSATSLDATLVATHSQLLTGLAPASTYHFRVTSKNSGGPAVSADFTFTTLHSPPVISGLAVSSITSSSAAVSWTTDVAADSQIEYGVTTAYGNATTLDATLVTTHSQSLAGLASGTTYHYHVRSRNSDGVAATSADATFVTQAVPVIINLAISNIQGASAAITWQTDLPADTQVEYGLTTAYGTASVLNTTLSTGHGQAISGLLTGTLYHLRARSRNALGNLGVSSDTTFTTAPAPIVTAVGTSGVTATSAVVSWTTDLASSTKIEYGLTGSYGSQTPLDPALVTAHSQTISGLTPGTTYFFLVRSITAQNALTKVGGFTFTTMAPPVIGGVGSSAVTGTSATINWSTNHAADSQVEYGPTTTYGSTTTLDATLVTTHVQALTGLTPLTTYHYRVKSQSAGGSTTSGDFTFATPEPPPVISSVAVSAITSSTATIAWTTDRLSGSVVEYGLTSTYGSLTIVPSAHVTSHTVGLTGLAANTTYHYRVTSAGDGGPTSSADATFTTLDLPPAISGVTSSAITTTSATIGWTTDRASTSEVDYGATTAYGNTTGLDPAAVVTHSESIAGLTPGTAYHYRVKSTTSGGAATSADGVFTTLEPVPAISNVLASAVTTTAATIGWTTDRASDSQVEYGLTTAYGNATSVDATLVTTHAQALAGLAPASTYHYRVKSKTNGGTTVSGDFTFATVEPPPIISGILATGVTSTSATIAWATDRASDSQVQYGVTTAYGSTTVLDAAPVTAHTQTLSGLTAGTLYHYRVKSQTNGGLSMSADLTFTTQSPPPVISAVVASAVTTTSAAIGWTTDQATDSQVEYGVTTSYGSATALDTALVVTHSQQLSALTSGATYHYRVKSRNAGGQLATSADGTFTTVAAPNITNLLVSNIQGASAAINWQTDVASDTQVEFGPTTAYGTLSVVNSTLSTSHGQAISGLIPGTLYHLRARSRNALGNLGLSVDMTFTTAPAPVITAVATTNLTGTSVVVTWTTDLTSNSKIEYGTTLSYGSQTTLDPALVTSHSHTISGLTAGVTYFFLVRSTTAQNALSKLGGFSFTTLTPPVISNVTASSITSSGATIGWTTSNAADSLVEYGTTTAYGSTTAVDPALVTSHSQALTGLASLTTYHYRVKSTGGGGTAVSGDATFTTLVSAPLISNVSASAITQTSATIGWTTNVGADSRVDYGLTSAYGQTTTLDPSAVTAHAQLLTGLVSGTTYHYRVRSATSGGSTTSADATFATIDRPPVISNVSASGITTTAATIGWTTDLAADSQVEYGLTTSYGSTTAFDPALTTTHGQSLTGLASGTTYHYRVRSATAGGATFSADAAFTTSVSGPIVTNVNISNIQGASAAVTWHTDQSADTQIEYGLTTAYGTTTVLNSTLMLDHGQAISGLQPGTTYQLRIRARNAAGVLGLSSNFTFTTAPAPVITNVASTAANTTVTVTWTTDLLSNSKIEYGLTASLGSQTTLDPALVTSHSHQITGLTPGATYYFLVRSITAQNALAKLGGFTVTTLTAPVVSSVNATGVTGTSATIQWTTSQPADTQVEYGPTTAYGSTTTLDAALVTAHAPVLTGLTPLSTYHYRVLSRNAGGLTTSGDFTFTTLQPAPVISNVTVTASFWNVALVTWTTDLPSDSQLEYGTTTAYGSTTALPNLVTTHLNLTMGPLAATTTYHFRVRSATNGGVTYSGDMTYTTTVPPPVISNVSASAITASSATIGWTTDLGSDTQVEYGLTAAYGSSTVLGTALVTAHAQVVSGLAPGTTYHYRVLSRSSGGYITSTPDATFTTLLLPVITNVVISNIQGATAAVTWQTNQPTDTQIEFGVTTNYGSMTTLVTTLTTDHGQAIAGLQPGTTYQMRVRARNAAGNLGTSGNFTFTTAPAPVITAVATTNLTPTSVVVTWTTDLPSNSKIEYGLTLSYGSQTTLDPALVTSHSHTISGLTPGTTYFFLVRATTGQNALSKLGGFTFTTPQ